ncbi:MAG TPA: PEP-CTERM sorting domain-containing protein [Thermoguttaceae bacterium]|nr:PEP-CTERM sorting domain-containing protein [Thermoguttaceae bacterium]HPP53947.1 PEP-CTERM sorting domain-containing protein [Thermoguttaceae bacterium]
MHRYVFLAVAGLMLGLVPGQAWAVVIFSETFDGPNLPTTLTYTAPGGYSQWLLDNGRLFCDYPGSVNVTDTALTTVGFIAPGDLKTIYSLDVGIPTGASIGSYNVGIAFGGYQAVFHPGYTQVPGAFRIEGGYITSNMSMGFVPKMGVMHHMEVMTQFVPAGLAVTITVTGLGTDDQMHTFTYSFLDTTPNLNTGVFGARRSGGTSANALSDAWFDNFQVEYVPEPATSTLLLLGGLGAGVLVCGTRRRRAGPLPEAFSSPRAESAGSPF